LINGLVCYNWDNFIVDKKKYGAMDPCRGSHQSPPKAGKDQALLAMKVFKTC
jgi:hypothetical protein